MMSVHDMREFLKNEVKHVQITPEMGDGHIKAMYNLYQVIMSYPANSPVRNRLAYIFTMIEEGNHDVQATIDDLKAQNNIGAIAEWDYMGVPADD